MSAGADPSPSVVQTEPAAGPRVPRLELFATLLLAVAATLTAWSSFESAKWNGVQATAFSEAGAARVESTRAATLAGQQTTVDVITFTQWLEALREDVLEDPEARAELRASGYQPDPQTVSGFLYLRFRPEFRPAVQSWLAERPVENAAAAATPFQTDAYVLEAAERADELLVIAEDRAQAARNANQRSDDYVLTTVAFALVLFFAAVSTKLVRERNQLIAFGLAVVTLLAAAVVLVTFPVEI